MKVLLTGILSPVIWSMVDRLVRNGHQVSLLGRGISPAPTDAKAVLHDISPNHPDAQQVLQGGRFQAVVFFYTYGCEDDLEHESVQGAMLDALFQLQHTASCSSVEQFLLVTDMRVFGKNQKADENKTPIPDTRTGILIKAAEDCLRFSDSGSMKTLLVRVTSLYAANAPDAFFSRALYCLQAGQVMMFAGPAATPCDFLHADDFSLFLALVLDKMVTGIIHLPYGEDCTYGEAADILCKHLPDLKVKYGDGDIPRPRLQGLRAKTEIRWIPRHHWQLEMDEILAKRVVKAEKHGFFDWFSDSLRRLFSRALPWVELILFGTIIEFLLKASSTNTAFYYVDYWLLYAILMGTLHGESIGIMAGLIACGVYAVSWTAEGNDLYLLLYNMDNWLKLIIYLLSGGFFGYLHDKNIETLKTMETEKEQRNTETEFIEKMYMQVDADRNALQEQVICSRDSYGRIYSITKELDTLQPEQIFLSTLDVLEDVMQNHSVTLYSCKSNTSFARIVVHSREMSDLPKSLNLDAFPLIQESHIRGEIFTNKQLAPGYPAFCAPIMQDEKLICLIALWNVPFDQQTLYHKNLFNVVSGLMQPAMIRALQYLNIAQDLYESNTHIQSEKAFRQTLLVYTRIQNQHASFYLLLSMRAAERVSSLEEIDRRLGRAARSTDIAGMLDGKIYVLLPGASLEYMPVIEKRFHSAGLLCEVTSTEVDNA